MTISNHCKTEKTVIQQVSFSIWSWRLRHGVTLWSDASWSKAGPWNINV